MDTTQNPQQPLTATTGEVQASAMALRREQWKTRCLELAQQHHLIGAARWERVSEMNPSVEIFTVPSMRDASRHVVGHDLVSDVYLCDCTAAQYGNGCSHVGSVIAAIMRRNDLLEQVYRACETWEREGLGGSLLAIYREMEGK